MCNRFLVLSIQDEEMILRTDLRVVYNKNEYSGEEAARFAETKSFSINSVGDSILVKLKSGRIQVEWRSDGGFTIMVGCDQTD